jgi:hypothetical protein
MGVTYESVFVTTHKKEAVGVGRRQAVVQQETTGEGPGGRKR